MIAVLAATVLAQGVVTVEVCKGPVTALAFGPGGVLYAGGERTLVRVSAQGKIDERHESFEGKISAVVVSPSGVVCTAGGIPQVRSEIGLLLKELDRFILLAKPGDGHYNAVAWDPVLNGPVVGGDDGTIQAGDPKVDGSREIKPLTGHSGPVLALAVLPGGSLVSGGRDGVLRVYGSEPRKLLRSLSFHTGPIHAIALPGIVQGPIWCATASEDKTIRIWQPEIGRMVRIIRGAEGPLLALAITPDGTRLISGGAEGIVRMQSVDGGDPTATWRVNGEWIHSIAISPDGKKLAFGASDGKVRIVGI